MAVTLRKWEREIQYSTFNNTIKCVNYARLYLEEGTKLVSYIH